MTPDLDALLDSLDGVCYVIDPSGLITRIGRANWNRFAASNGGSIMLNGAGVVGRSLYDFIDGEAIRATYQRYIDAVVAQDRGRAIVQCQCSSPDMQRGLRIAITPIRGHRRVDQVLIQSITVAEMMRPPLALFDFAASQASPSVSKRLPILAMCSFCQQVRHPAGSSDATGEWLAAEAYYRRGGSNEVRISHAMCPTCADCVDDAFDEAA